MRFRSGTLNRSIKRWGPNTDLRKFQRKQFGWKYVIAEELAIAANGTDAQEVGIIDATDWQTAGGTGCRNISFDLVTSVCWTPQSSATDFDTGGIVFGYFAVDGDQPGYGDALLPFAEMRALSWHAWFVNFGELLDNPSGAGVAPTDRNRQVRQRFKQRFLKFDEEVRLVISTLGDYSGVISDLRLNVFGRVSWELP